MTKDLTTGSPGKTLLEFSAPLLVCAIFQQFYSMADSAIAGRFVGKEALAAIGASYPVTMIIMAIAIGLNTEINENGGLYVPYFFLCHGCCAYNILYAFQLSNAYCT